MIETYPRQHKMAGSNSYDHHGQQQGQCRMSNDVLAAFLDEVLREIVQHNDGSGNLSPTTTATTNNNTAVDDAKNRIDIVLDNARFHDSYTTSPSPRRRSKKMTPFMFQYKKACRSNKLVPKSNRWEETSKSNEFIAKQVSSLKQQQPPIPPTLPPSMSTSIIQNGATSRWESMMANTTIHNCVPRGDLPKLSPCSITEDDDVNNSSSNNNGHGDSDGSMRPTTASTTICTGHNHNHSHNHNIDTQLPNVPERKAVFDRFTLANSPNYMRRSKRNLFMRSNSLQKLQQQVVRGTEDQNQNTNNLGGGNEFVVQLPYS